MAVDVSEMKLNDGLNEYREARRIQALVKKHTWSQRGENVPITAANSRELEGDSLIYSAFHEGISLLDHLQADGREVSMREYGKIFSWTADQLKNNWNKQIQQDKKEGWQVTAHHWPGEDNSLLSKLRLSQTEYDISFKKKFDEGVHDWDGISSGEAGNILEMLKKSK